MRTSFLQNTKTENSGNDRGIHLVYHIQIALAQGGEERAWLSSEFYQEINDWKTLVAQTVAHTNHLVGIVRRDPNHLGFCDASGIGEGDVWLDPSRAVPILVWHHPWTPGIIVTIISDKKPVDTLTNSNLSLSDLVLQEASVLDVCPEANMAAPRSGSDNTPNAYWSTREEPTINLVVADLLCIPALH